jgi:hypothetical protein
VKVGSNERGERNGEKQQEDKFRPPQSGHKFPVTSARNPVYGRERRKRSQKIG